MSLPPFLSSPQTILSLPVPIVLPDQHPILKVGPRLVRGVEGELLDLACGEIVGVEIPVPVSIILPDDEGPVGGGIDLVPGTGVDRRSGRAGPHIDVPVA